MKSMDNEKDNIPYFAETIYTIVIIAAILRIALEIHEFYDKNWRSRPNRAR